MQWELTDSAPDFSSFTFHEEVNSAVLILQDAEQSVLKFNELRIASPWHRNTLSLTGSCLFFDEMFNVVIVNIICRKPSCQLIALLSKV